MGCGASKSSAAQAAPAPPPTTSPPPLPPAPAPAAASSKAPAPTPAPASATPPTPPKPEEKPKEALLPADCNIVFVLGGPGSGKGTQCERIVAKYGYKHLSAGDLLRAEVASGSETGNTCAKLMKEGQLVPLEVTIGLLKAAMIKSGARDFLIDGFPRALDQAEAFEAQVMPCKKVLFFDCPLETMQGRLLKRGETSGRADDNIETIKKRFDTFTSQSLPVVTHYAALDKAYSVSAVPPPEDVFSEVIKVFDGTAAPSGPPEPPAPPAPVPEAPPAEAETPAEAPAEAPPADAEAAPAEVEVEAPAVDAPAAEVDGGDEVMGDRVMSSIVPDDCNVVFVLGGPGSGKGTQCERIVRDFGYKHLSAGDLLREEVASGSEIGTMCATLMKEGQLVPLEVTIGLLKAAMIKSGARDFLIDGFPRALDQAEAFEAQVMPCKKVLFFDCPLETMQGRLLKRGETSGRADDNIETIKKRFDTFTSQSLPVIDHYKRQGKVHAVSSVPPPDEVYSQVSHIFLREGDYEGEECSKAAIKIQSNFRGRRTREIQAKSTEVQVVFYQAREWYGFPGVDVDGDGEVDEPRAITKSTITPSAAQGPKGDLVIAHFNDVYEIGENKQEPVGGAARLAGVIDQWTNEGLNPLVLFSGDALNPSLLSQGTKGAHMIEVLNKMNIAVACVGNHDLDFGVENLNNQILASNFPWLCSNCWHADTGKPLGDAEEAVVVCHGGYKIGIIGLIEEDWLECCTTIDPSTLNYRDFVDVGRDYARKLREEEGVDIVIALSHFREPNDERLASEVPEIDLVLGGHDHHYAAKKCEPTGTWYVKSGADFRLMSKVVMRPGEGGARGEVTVDKVEVTSSCPPNREVHHIAEGYLAELRKQMEKPLGVLAVELDSRFAEVRTKETNCGNWCSDVMREGLRADIGLLNSGTLRADVVYPPGPFTVEDLMKLLPFSNELMVVAVKGADVIDLLENGVSQWPKKEGRFPCMSNLTFTFDGNKPAGERVEREGITVGGEPLDLEKEYKVAGLDFALKGKEGYDAFLRGRVVMDEEQATPLGTLMRNHLACLRMFSNSHLLKRQKPTVERAKIAFRKFNTTRRPGQEHVDPDPSAVTPALDGRIKNLAEVAE